MCNNKNTSNNNKQATKYFITHTHTHHSQCSVVNSVYAAMATKKKTSRAFAKGQSTTA